jgi:hypothetical protein
MLLAIYVRSVRRARPFQLAATPEQRAKEALQAAAAALSGPSPDYVLFYTQVDAATRKYLAERTVLPSLTATTGELRRHMAGNGTNGEHAALIVYVLQECDTARWAHEYSGLAGAHASLDLAYQLIESVARNGHGSRLATANRPPETTLA